MINNLLIDGIFLLQTQKIYFEVLGFLFGNNKIAIEVLEEGTLKKITDELNSRHNHNSDWRSTLPTIKCQPTPTLGSFGSFI